MTAPSGAAGDSSRDGSTGGATERIPPASPTWPQLLRALVAGSELPADQAAWAMRTILAGNATDAQIAGFVTALRAKGETAGEVLALVEVLRAHMRPVPLDPAQVVLDVVGTGGDHSNSVNISTMAAIVAAAAGAPVVKHGNRAASSATGTADVLEELGVVIALEPDAVATCATDAGIAFCFAPNHHPAMRFVGPARRDLGIPTVFNVLGPLANPAGARAALIGTADVGRAPLMADVLHARAVAAVVVHGEDGLDEVSVSAPTLAWDATGSRVVTDRIDPVALGLPLLDASLLVGGDRVRNASLLRKALDPATPADDVDAAQVAAIRQAVALNAAVALVAYDAAVAGRPDASASLNDRIAAALPRAQTALASGAATRLLDTWIKTTKALAAP